MHLSLLPHPDTPPEAVTAIEVEVLVASPGTLELRYAVSGRIDQVRLAPLSASVRGDELWKTTCFEAFVRPTSGEGYLELNFAPSTRWAAYRFSGYRAGMESADIRPPRLAAESHPDLYLLSASFDLPVEGPRRLGLSAVIEEVDGRKSYWALAHAPGKPDFHHPDAFAQDLT